MPPSEMGIPEGFQKRSAKHAAGLSGILSDIEGDIIVRGRCGTLNCKKCQLFLTGEGINSLWHYRGTNSTLLAGMKHLLNENRPPTRCCVD
jgi:hypothetical protein